MSEEPKWGTREWHKLRPLYLSKEDMAKDLPTLIKELRRKISDTRGSIQDIKLGFGWNDRFALAEAGLTLVLIQLYNVLEEVEAAYKERDAAK